MNNRRKNNLDEQFVFRQILPQEADQAVAIEHICFPPHEACSEKMMRERVARVPELFFVAVDRKTGKLAGFLNGIATDEQSFQDEFFTDAGLNDPKGSTVMLLGLDVLPEYRGQGLATEIMMRYLSAEKEKGRGQTILTCLEEKVAMYERMGYHNRGIAASAWGGEQWYEMCYTLDRDPANGDLEVL